MDQLTAASSAKCTMSSHLSHRSQAVSIALESGPRGLLSLPHTLTIAGSSMA